MIKSPYNTAAFKSYQFQKTSSEVRRLEIEEKLIKLTPEGDILAVPLSAVEFPPFSMFLTKEQVPNLETDIVVDGRLFLRADGTIAKKEVADFYAFTGKLVKNWFNEGSHDLLSSGSDFLIKMYASWFRSAVSNRIGLDPAQILIVQIVATIYFIQQFNPIGEHGSMTEHDRILTRAARCIPGMDVYTLDGLLNGSMKPLNSVDDAADLIRELLNTPRAEKLTGSLVRMAAAYSWYPAYKDLSIAALEFPPLFASMVHHSLTVVAYSRTALGEILKRANRGNDSITFSKNLKALVNN